MRMSCNGCRVLRKGCSENCSIRPCLQWIPSPDAQANATVFLAKFYGRAGLINLINAGPEPLRPGIFRSLLYEACGRIVNPVYGSAGLLMSGSWHLCQAAVEAVLSGAPIVQVSSDSSIGAVSPPLKACDIRHVSRDEASLVAGAGQELPRVVKTRSRFKRSSSAAKPKPKELCAPPTAGVGGASEFETEPTRFKEAGEELLSRQPSHGSESDSASVETVEATLMKLDDPTHDNNNVELDLTLGFQPRPKARKVVPMMYGLGDATCKVEMTFDLLAA